MHSLSRLLQHGTTICPARLPSRGRAQFGFVSHRFYDIISIAGRFARRAWSFASSFCREKIQRTSEQ